MYIFHYIVTWNSKLPSQPDELSFKPYTIASMDRVTTIKPWRGPKSQKIPSTYQKSGMSATKVNSFTFKTVDVLHPPTTTTHPYTHTCIISKKLILADPSPY